MSDLEIAKRAKLKQIEEIYSSLGIDKKYINPYGYHIAKISNKIMLELKDKKDGKLILVTAISPTPAGEGKTTTSIGLSMALNKIGKSSIVTLREPSIGPIMGIKGGAAGGGYSQVLPMEDINLHFTGDFHAVSIAHNLLSAIIDNSIKNGNPLKIDTVEINWPRVIDMNDRSLRSTVISLGGRKNGYPREDHFIITAASEIMAILCLANDIEDLKERIDNIIISESLQGDYIKAKLLNVSGALATLLKDAINPNLVQTIENTPAIIHGGPFANIAHGTNTVIADKMALKLSDYVVTEAGFGADLGAEKFLDFLSPQAGFTPNAVVIVASIRALKYHGGLSRKKLNEEELEALEVGFENLKIHYENMKKYGIPVIVALNEFPTDSIREKELFENLCAKHNIVYKFSDVWAKGSEGGIELAEEVVKLASENSDYKPLLDSNMSFEEKMRKLTKEIYRASDYKLSSEAKRKLKKIKKNGYDKLPIIIAKTQYSITHDAKMLNNIPDDYIFQVDDMWISGGAGFLVVVAGGINLMPGLPKIPNAEFIDIDNNSNIEGLF
ncbi:MAG: formate--tetrahydrofolate ligase [Kosmotogales bacterium]|nr:formate--tetrahydrofolate ligase [Kosmotogales bacterium]